MPAVLAGLAVVACVVALVVWLGNRAPKGTEQDTAPETTPSAVDPVGPAGPLQPTGVAVKWRQDTLAVTWRNPDPQPGDRYVLHLQKDPAAVSREGEGVETDRTRIELPTRGERCVTVTTLRGSQSSEPALKCDLSG